MISPLRVSVVIPTYNRARLLAVAIDSVLAQSYQDFEIIVIDDGSTDETKRALEFYLLRQNFRYFYQDNQKQAAARNLGIQKAQGEYVAFLDSDDLWSPAKLELQVKVLDDHPEVGMVYSNQMMFRDKPDAGTIRCRPGTLKSGDIFRDLLLRRFYCSTQTILVRRSVIDDVGGFNESLRNALEDWEFTLRVSQRYPIYAIDQPLVWRRIHAEASSDYQEIRIQNHSRILERYLADPSLDNNFRRTVFSKACFSWGNASFLARRYKKARAYFSEAFRNGHRAAALASGLSGLRGLGRAVYFALYRRLRGADLRDLSSP